VIQNFNRYAAELWGRAPVRGDTDVRFCGSFKLFHPDGSFMPHDQSPMAEVASGKIREVRDQEALLERPDGSRVAVVVNIRPLKNQHGEVAGAINCFYDITERKLAEAALIKSEKLAAAGRLAAALAHEINNPLQAVTNLLSLLGQSTSMDTQDHEYATMASEELGRVTHLTQQSLGFYRESISPTAVNVEEVAESILNLYAKRITAKKITIIKQYQSDGATIASYPGEIRQVFTTLLVNAMEAVSTGGSFALRISKSTDWRKHPPVDGLRITLADSGCGIPTHNIARVFEPFFTTKGESGTGLGLWVAQGIANRLGGSIRMRSSVHPEKSGTCFSVFLPNGKAK
jgi:two-component system CheB/CheR fusion protein